MLYFLHTRALAWLLFEKSGGMPLRAGEGQKLLCPPVGVRRRSVFPKHRPPPPRTPFFLNFGVEGVLIRLSNFRDPPPPPPVLWFA